MMRMGLHSRGLGLRLSVSVTALLLAAASAHAQTTDVGTVDVSNGKGGALPLSAPMAVGSKAPPGSAPALAPSQGSLDSIEPVSIVSDKVLRDIVAPSSDYNAALKYVPGWNSANPNGLFGDSKGGWRGFVDGQYNITFDGIPFGDYNDPTHHSAAYFPAGFLSSITVDRGPGPASQVGYATFGGTMALHSTDLTEQMGGNVTMGYGSFNTLSNIDTFQTGRTLDGTTRAVVQYVHNNTDGALQYGSYVQNQFQGKVQTDFGDWRATLYLNYGTENYNNVTGITWQQLQLNGKSYGAVGNIQNTQQYVDYNDSRKQTDMEYFKIEGETHGIHLDNTTYTYSYWYPSLQNNGADQTIVGSSGAVTSVKIPLINGSKQTVKIKGVAATDVTGYVKDNDYRAFGNILRTAYDVDGGMASGQLRTGLWAEYATNGRQQNYIDYTTGMLYQWLGNSMQASYKLQLTSNVTNVSPYIEYEWKPIDGLSVTPGFKYEAFTRAHDALVNQTTLQPINYSHTYTAALPYLSVNYHVTPEISVYAQASQGFLAPTVSAYYVFNPGLAGIQPQTTNNFQAGAVYKSEKLAADFDAYRIISSNYPLNTTTSTGQSIYVNAGTALYQGLEAEGTYVLMEGLSVYASAALIEAQFTSGPNNGLRAPDAPNYTAAGGFIYDNGFIFGSLLQKFTGGFYGSSGEVASTATVNNNLNYVKAYNTTDFAIGLRSSALHDLGIGNSMKVRLGINNILNHTNTVEIAGAPSTLMPSNASTLTYQFLPGRTFYGTVTIDF